MESIAVETREPLANPPREEEPCVCNGGWVTMGQTAWGPETGEECEEYALYLCQQCKPKVK